jgi:GR25 family glycosyltransferase involved in LPS biosynthesis
MAMLPWRRILVLCLLVFGLLMTAGLSNGPRIREHFEDAWQGAIARPTEYDRTSSPTKFDSTSSTTGYDSTLSIAAKVFVANLPRRGDRRRNMTTLEHAVGAHFTFVDAIDMRSVAIRNIMNHIRAQREGPAVPFAWPSTRSAVPLDWTGHLPSGVHVNKKALTCNQGDATPIPAESAQGWDWLSEGRISCWETHLRIIRQIADMRGSGYWSTGRALPISPADVAIILEDDVDMELDIRERLLGLWPSLPKEWDMVFFGESHTSFLDINLPAHTHCASAGWCWATEGKNAAIGTFTPAGTNQTNALRPSDAPQCTHAYALSIPGARKLLAHLEYPPFAYSRAIDQAYVHLIMTNRVLAYTIDPAVVIQRKMDKGDLGEGAVWGETLYNPALGK